MNNPAPAASSIGDWTSTSMDGTRALRTGLELARASQLTMLRLQLALHKSNRRTAMQALDHLLDIDAEMEGLAAALNSVPVHPASDAALSGFIGLQKAAIAAEKHALTGGDWRRDAGVDFGSMAISAPGNWAGDADSPAQLPLSDDEAGSSARRWIPVLTVAILVIGMGIGLTAYLSPTLLAALASLLDLR